jgi:hypothetical protein
VRTSSRSPTRPYSGASQSIRHRDARPHQRGHCLRCRDAGRAFRHSPDWMHHFFLRLPLIASL